MIGIFLRDIQFIENEESAQLNTESLCIKEMFLWELGKKFKTNDCEAIFFHCGRYSKIRLISESYEDYDMFIPKKSYDVEIPFDTEVYFSLSIIDKKKMLTDCLQKGMIYLTELKKWDLDKINEAFRAMSKKEFIHTFKVWKPKLSPNRKLKAYPLLNIDLLDCTLGLVVEDRKGNIIARKHIVKTKPNIAEIDYFLEKLVWLSDKEVALFTRAHKTKYNSILLEGN
ncbi:hypothetical protein MHB63_04105 [Bacillus sp. FSL H8-0547]